MRSHTRLHSAKGHVDLTHNHALSLILLTTLLMILCSRTCIYLHDLDIN